MMAYTGPRESYHTVRELDISHLPVEVRIALYNTSGSTAYFLESAKGTKRIARDSWFECPVTGEFYPRSQGVRIRGILYSQEAAQDILEERRRSAL